MSIGCPKCNAQLMFAGGRSPHIDACGFESYSFECVVCDSALTGIIDPYDEALLLSECQNRPWLAAA